MCALTHLHLQELANLERFTKRQQHLDGPPQKSSHAERLLKEEAYLKSRLNFVQQVRRRRVVRKRVSK